jgi:DedD protein
MESRVRERLVGALVLVGIVVLFVPAILTGRGTTTAAPPGPETRRAEFPVDDAAPQPEELVLVPEPVADAPAPAEAAARKASEPPPKGTASEPTPSIADARESRAAAPRSEKATAATSPAINGSTQAWAVQIGAFSSREKAEQQVAQLRERRYAAFILEYRASGKVLYRVRVGPEQDRARAAEIAARLAKDGFQPVVARHP